MGINILSTAQGRSPPDDGRDGSVRSRFPTLVTLCLPYMYTSAVLLAILAAALKLLG